ANSAGLIFRPIFEGDREFLTNSGIARSISEAIGAAPVNLYVKIPGAQKREFARFTWPREDSQFDGPQKISESDVDPIARHTMEMGTEQRSVYENRPGFSLSSYFPLRTALGLPSEIAEPLIFHGAVIGCLQVTGKNSRNFSPTEVQRIRDLTTFVTLEVQSFREAASLEQIGFRFSRMLLTKEPIIDLKTPIEEIAKILHDILTPYATGLWVDIGLHGGNHAHVVGDEHYCNELRHRIAGQRSRDDSLEVVDMPLSVKRGGASGEIRIGRLALLVPSD